MMNEHGKSDSPVVPAKPPNKAERPAAEAVEGRGLAKGNPPEHNAPRTQSRAGAPSALERVRQAAQRDKEGSGSPRSCTTSTTSTDLRQAYFALKREAAPGIDGETWQQYGEDLEENLQDLSRRLARGSVPGEAGRGGRTSRRRTGGSGRSAVPALEDKIVQRAVVEVLNAIYEADFLGFSYGFRPGRSPHHALDALVARDPCGRR